MTDKEIAVLRERYLRPAGLGPNVALICLLGLMAVGVAGFVAFWAVRAFA